MIVEEKVDGCLVSARQRPWTVQDWAIGGGKGIGLDCQKASESIPEWMEDQ